MEINCFEIFYIFIYNIDFVIGLLFFNERVINLEIEKLNLISNVYNCGVILKENICKIFKYFVVYLCKFFLFLIFIVMM